MLETLQTQFGTSYQFLQANLKGFEASHARTSPQLGGNSATYLLSHIVATRQAPLAFSGQQTVWQVEKIQRWGRSAAPLGVDEPSDWNALLSDLEQSQKNLSTFLAALTPSQLEQPTPMGTLGAMLNFLATHEAYHVGQLSMLRRALGMEGVIQ